MNVFTNKGNKLNKNERVGLAVVALLGVTQLASCTFSDVDASTVGCVFSGGPLDGSEYQEYVKPGGGREMVGWLEEITEYPVGVRQFAMSLTPGQGDTPNPEAVNVKVKGVDQRYEATLNFTISSVFDPADKPAGCELIEQHLRPLSATDFTGGRKSKWVTEFLNERLKNLFIDEAVKVLQGNDPTELANNTDGARDKAAKLIGEKLTTKFADALGGNFFCSPSYSFGDPAENCGNISITLLAPKMSDADAELIAAPQRSKTEADNAIAVAQQDARKASDIAEQKQIEADSAKALADAEEQIAREEGRVILENVANTYAWCSYLVSLGQPCAEVKAAENSDFPNVVVGSSDAVVAIPVPAED